jgi:hypothetical protein
MRAPGTSNPALRKAAKGAVMAGTAVISAIAVGTLVKKRLNAAEADPGPRREAE